MMIIFWALFILLFWTYFGYLFFLLLLTRIKRGKEKNNSKESYSKVSVIIAAYNEENLIKRRIENLLKLNYPKEKMEIIVASDGSTDRTVHIAKSFGNKVKVLDFKENRGRAMVHNDAVREAKGEIIVFTDASTEFKSNFLKEIAEPFKNLKVGCTVGNLIYKTKGTSISESENLYFKFEKKLRKIESNLGILATASGACMAVRKNLFKNLSPVDDCDFTTPLDVLLQGHKVIFVKNALCYDFPPSSIEDELKTKIRQTSKNFIGTLKKWGLKNWLKHPILSWELLSHKILRWLTPFFLLGLFITNIFLLDYGMFYKVIFSLQVMFYVLAFLGFISEIFKKKISFLSPIFSFLLANIGMGIGVIKGILGKAPKKY